MRRICSPRCVEMLRPMLSNQSVDLVFDDASQIPPIFSDEGKVSQILRNFLSNSLKFTERGVIRVSATLAGPDEVSFSVSDTGIGIAPENLDRIFEDFSQVEPSDSTASQGHGAGSAACEKTGDRVGRPSNRGEPTGGFCVPSLCKFHPAMRPHQEPVQGRNLCK